jgi:class 3 adenylate cyclase
MEEVEEVQKAAALGYLDMDDDDEDEGVRGMNPGEIREGGTILFDDDETEDDDFVDEDDDEDADDEDMESETEEDDEDEYVLPGNSLRRSSRVLGPPLQPLYEEDDVDEDEESQATLQRGNQEEEGHFSSDSVQTPEMVSVMDEAAPRDHHRRSFVAHRRASVESFGSELSSHSAPPLSSSDLESSSAAAATADAAALDRRASFSTSGQDNSFTNIFGGSRRTPRQNAANSGLRASLKSIGSSASGLSEDSISTDHSSSSGTGGNRRPASNSRRGFPRLSNRRNFTRLAGSILMGSESSHADSNDLAVDKLQSSGGDWEQSAAAAAVVASRKGHSVQYSQGDRVLVLLTLLNFTMRQQMQQTGMEEEAVERFKAMLTLAPVNKAGFPEGEGRTESEKAGPFSYVLCTVQQVHFDEDERYYTIFRGDTETEQRAEAAWMEPVYDEFAMQAALLAARRTKSSLEGNVRGHEGGFGGKVFQALGNSWDMTTQWMTNWYITNRLRAKMLVTKILQGDSGFAFKIRLTGINFFVLCSFIFLFLDVVALGFLSAETDYAVAVIELAVWIILVFELLLEFLIRPEDYRSLVESDKAFAPSTARHISLFHLILESVALIIFCPSFQCVGDRDKCNRSMFGPGIKASVDAITAEEDTLASLGRFLLGLHFLRAFGLIRHWKQMWLKNTFEGDTSNSKIIRRLLLVDKGDHFRGRANSRDKKEESLEKSVDTHGGMDAPTKTASEEDRRLKNAATIGTALMVINSHRFLMLLLVAVTLYPVIYTYRFHNAFDSKLGDLLLAYNVEANGTEDCAYLQNAVNAWLGAASHTLADQRYLFGNERDSFLVWAQIEPVRCDWQGSGGIITSCTGKDGESMVCDIWNQTITVSPSTASEGMLASMLGLRPGALREFDDTAVALSDFVSDGDGLSMFRVRAFFDLSHTVSYANRSLFFLLVTLLIQCFVGLTMMRRDAGRLVLHPLQRMLKIVVRYAENPLSQTLSGQQKSLKEGEEDVDGEKASDELGNFETEQLINAIAKIADLLRKCWGVAGAGIISSNLARTEDGKNAVFNPTVPGKRVYALFGFVAINYFGRMLRVLEQDTLALINDVAKVVHDEVFRWALGDSGQCNKNLGGAFLMVFRIGDFTEVHDKKKRATDVVFDSQTRRRNLKVRRRVAGGGRSTKARGKRGYASTRHLDNPNDGTLQLASLPGIQNFTDRALLGFLKSFAGLNRDDALQEWRKDFRLGAGVGAFKVSVMYGMDAGWAVEGAVGSEYKIDATYLSPHVNMASRMMSATKQYGVTILLSQAVEELLSKPARGKLRHLDTVKVKGSNVAQRIFTFDAKHEGVDFFLFERTPDQADAEGDAYTTHIWELDQDLNSMRQHVSDEFMAKFKEGVDLYIDGKWTQSIEVLKDADELMMETVLESGYIDYDDIDDLNQVLNRNNRSEEVQRARNELGDGACKSLIQYMSRRNGVPPADWRGVRALMSK